jgi:hypothetical protein
MSNSDNTPINAKQFSLKPIEAQMVNTINQQSIAAMSNFLSYIALERLGYTVTENTQFELGDSGKLLIWEGQPVRPPVDIAGGGDSDTAKAMKGNK